MPVRNFLFKFKWYNDNDPDDSTAVFMGDIWGVTRINQYLHLFL